MKTTVNSYEEYLNIGRVKQTTTKRTSMNGQDSERVVNQYEKSFWDAKNKKYTIQSRTAFIKLYVPVDESKADLFDVLEDDPTNIGRIMLIIRHIDSNNMIIYKDKHTRTGAPANKELLYKMTGYDNRNSARRFINKMTDKGIIKEWKCDDYSRYYINPIYTMADRGITVELYSLFKEELDLVLPEKAKKELSALLYFGNNPHELVKLQEENTQKQEEELDELFESICSSPSEIQEETKDVEVSSLESVLYTEEKFNHEAVSKKIELVTNNTVSLIIDQKQMNMRVTVYLMNLIKEFASSNDIDTLIAKSYGAFKKEATTTSANVVIALN